MTDVQSPFQFLNDFYSLIKKAEYRIFIQSMNFESGEILDHLSEALIEKAKAGIDIRLHIDWIAQRYIHETIILLPELNKKRRAYQRSVLEKNIQLRERLIQAGVTFIDINKPSVLSKIVPIIGRNHRKIYLVDEKAAWIGGVNLSDFAFHNLDCMVKLYEPHFIQQLARQFYPENMILTKDSIVDVGDGFRLLLDGGKRGSSIIYDSSTALIQNSQHSVLFISQFLPDGPLLDCLIRKHMQGVKVLIYTSPQDSPGFARFPYKFSYRSIKKKIEQHGLRIHYLTKKVHAKILMSDNASVIIGSHNLVNIGVRLGTAEIAIWSQNHNFVNRFTNYLYSDFFKYDEELFFGGSLPFFI